MGEFSGKKGIFILWLLLLPHLLAGRQATGLPPDKQLPQFIIDHWDERNGLPYNTFNHIMQSKEGFLWLSTFDGLLRFDGKLFDAYTQATDSTLRSSGFYQAAESPDGRLWLATQGSGLAYHTAQGIQLAGVSFKKAISALQIAPDGTPWLGTINEGAYYFSGGVMIPLECTATKETAIRDIEFDAKGLIWMATEGKGIVVVDSKGACNTVYAEESGLPSTRISSLVHSKSGVWVGTTAGLCLLQGGKASVVPEMKDINITDLLEDGYNNLWIATTKGLARRKPNGQIDWLDGIAQANIESICLDRENSLWIATKGAGLYRIRSGKFLNYSPALGLSNPTVTCAFEWSRDSLLVGTEKGTIDWIIGGKVINMPLPDLHGQASVKNMYKDPQGNLWIITYGGLFKRLPDGKFEFFSKEKNGFPENRLRGIYPAGDGSIWVGTRSSGLIRINTAGEILQKLSKEHGLGANYIMCLEKSLQGGLMIGTNGGGLSIMDANGSIKTYKDEAGFKGTIIFGLLPGKDGKVWVASNSGLCYWQDGKFFNFSRRGGLPPNTPFDVKEDASGNMWMPSSDGVIVVDKTLLMEYEQGKTDTLPYRLYDHSDGLVSKECTGATNALQMANGQLAFPNIKGVSFIDPKQIPLNRLSPTVVIKRMLADNRGIALLQNIVLAPGTKRFTFDFAALSFVSPPKVLFKYMLEGVDPTWINAANERSATYTNLPPGTYTFRVIACNNDGYWNHSGASITFTLEPYFYQRPIAYILGIALFLAAVFAIYKARVRRIKRRNEELERLVSERTAEINQQKEEIQAQRDKISEALDKIQTVSDIGREVTSIIKSSDLAPLVYQHVKKLMTADCFGIGIFNIFENSLQFNGFIERGVALPPHSESVKSNSTLASKCFNSQQMIWINHFKQDYSQYFDAMPLPLHGEHTQSAVFLPLAIEDRIVGVLTVQSFAAEAYLPEHLTFLQALASYIAISLDNANAYEQIDSKNRHITDSLRYAQTIQEAILPAKETLKEAFADHFVMYKPKDIVSGDFYWMAKVDNVLLLAVVDCTGHGVPGALMSMIGNELLNEIVGVEHILSPAQILEELHARVVQNLRQDERKNSDGMDLALCALVKQGELWKVTFAGAKRPLLYTEDGEIKIAKPDRRHIGGIFVKKSAESAFQNQEIFLNSGECLYLMTDGLADQAWQGRSKVGTQTIVDMLGQHHKEEMPLQLQYLSAFLENDAQGATQRDDIAVVGVRLK